MVARRYSIGRLRIRIVPNTIMSRTKIGETSSMYRFDARINEYQPYLRGLKMTLKFFRKSLNNPEPLVNFWRILDLAEGAANSWNIEALSIMAAYPVFLIFIQISESSARGESVPTLI